jgi:hypothetical protein
LTLGKGTFIVFNTITQYKIPNDKCIAAYIPTKKFDEFNNQVEVLGNYLDPEDFRTTLVNVWPKEYFYDLQIGNTETTTYPNTTRVSSGWLPRDFNENQTIFHIAYYSGEEVVFPSTPLIGINVDGGNTTGSGLYINPPGNSYGFVSGLTSNRQIDPTLFPWNIPCLTCQEKWNWGGGETSSGEPLNTTSYPWFSVYKYMYGNPPTGGLDPLDDYYWYTLKDCGYQGNTLCLPKELEKGAIYGNTYWRMPNAPYVGDRWVHNGYAIKLSGQTLPGVTLSPPREPPVIPWWGIQGFTGILDPTDPEPPSQTQLDTGG